MSRSFHYVSADAFTADWPEAAGGDADALLIDLDGAVAAGETREATRKTVASWLRGEPAIDAWVRISPGPPGHDDARELVGPGLRGVFAAKTESVVQLDALDLVLSTVEREAGLPNRSIGVIAMLESAGSVMIAPAIARAPRVVRLHVAEAALMAELNIEPSPDEAELLTVRSLVVLASAAAGIEPPLGPSPHPDHDAEQVRASTLRLRRLGYRGRLCEHAAHITVVNATFSR